MSQDAYMDLYMDVLMPRAQDVQERRVGGTGTGMYPVEASRERRPRATQEPKPRTGCPERPVSSGSMQVVWPPAFAGATPPHSALVR